MKNQEISKQIQSLNNLFKKTNRACNDDFEMQAHWANYLCVRCAGLLENALKEIYSTFVKDASSPPVARFATSRLNKVQNPKTTRFIDMAGSFKTQWKDELIKFVDQEGRREAIDSIMNNRHQIVHGQTVDITITRIQAYLEKSVEVIDFIERQCANTINKLD